MKRNYSELEAHFEQCICKSDSSIPRKSLMSRSLQPRAPARIYSAAQEIFFNNNPLKLSRFSNNPRLAEHKNTDGAKHKQKESDKETSQRHNASGQIIKENLAQLDTPISKAAKADAADKSEKSKDKKKTPLKDVNGNIVKKPLTAYMLFNNYRRPTLHSEHPGKFKAPQKY